MIEKSLVDELNAYLCKNLSKKRYEHSVNVANEALSIAKKYNYDCDKAYFAGLVHDICKEKSDDIQQKLVIESGLNVSAVELKSKPLWHAIAGAEFLKNEFHIEDVDILNAVRYHTVGRNEMSPIEKTVYLADLVSADRKYKDVEKMRKICYKNIDEAMFEALKFLITLDIEKGHTIPPSTFEAYNEYSILYSK